MPTPDPTECTELIAVDRDEDRGLVTIRDTSFIRSIAEISEILSAPIAEDDLDVKPDGSVYASHCHVSRRLDEAFSPMGWRLKRKKRVKRHPDGTEEVTDEFSVSTQTDKYNNTVTTVAAEFELWIRQPDGRWEVHTEAFGEGEYNSKNSNAGFTDATESAYSQALTRCAKHLGIAREVWDRHYTDRWRAANCVQVRTKRWDGQLDTNKDGSPKLSWKRRDSTLHNEYEPQQRGAHVGFAPNSSTPAPQQPLTKIEDPYTLPASVGDCQAPAETVRGMVDRVISVGDRFGVALVGSPTIYGTGSRVLAEWALAHEMLGVEILHTVESRGEGKPPLYHLRGIRRHEAREPGDDEGEALEGEVE